MKSENYDNLSINEKLDLIIDGLGLSKKTVLANEIYTTQLAANGSTASKFCTSHCDPEKFANE